MRTVKFTGGPMHGAVIRCTPEVADRVNDRAVRIVVTPGKQLFDQLGQRIVRGAELVELPLHLRAKPKTSGRRGRVAR